MIFQFQSKDGKILEKDFPIGKCPENIKYRNKKYTRIFSTPLININKGPSTVHQIALKNTERMEKEGTLKKEKKKAWWRDSHKVDTSLAKLKGKKLERYLLTGKK